MSFSPTRFNMTSLPLIITARRVCAGICQTSEACTDRLLSVRDSYDDDKIFHCCHVIIIQITYILCLLNYLSISNVRYILYFFHKLPVLSLHILSRVQSQCSRCVRHHYFYFNYMGHKQVNVTGTWPVWIEWSHYIVLKHGNVTSTSQEV